MPNLQQDKPKNSVKIRTVLNQNMISTLKSWLHKTIIIFLWSTKMMKIDYADKSWVQEELDTHWHEHEIDAYVKIGRLALIAYLY
jgi:hypothetical protein